MLVPVIFVNVGLSFVIFEKLFLIYDFFVVYFDVMPVSDMSLCQNAVSGSVRFPGILLLLLATT